MTDDLQQARIEAASNALRERSAWPSLHWPDISGVNHLDTSTALAKAALAAADAHLPSVEQVAEVLHDADCGCGGPLEHDEPYFTQTRAVRDLFGEAAGDE